MSLLAQLQSGIGTIGLLVGAMAILAVIEAAIPLHARGHWHRAHLGPNLALTVMTFATNLLLNAALVLSLFWMQSNNLGLLSKIHFAPLATLAIVVLVLDFSFYVAHVSMHKVAAFWRYHRVHHSDPAVDVTTTIRQHPGESLIRYAFMAVFAGVLGAGPGAFAVYRAWSALNGLLEHANFRAPLWLDRALSLVTTWPYMHKIHHSRAADQTDTNYGNIFSWFDRLLGTFTPSERGVNIAYGLAGFDDLPTQTTAGLLALPFRTDTAAGSFSPTSSLRRA